MINDALTEKQIEDIVRQHFYPGPVAGSTERLTKALNAVIRQALKSLEDERDQWKRFAVENAEAVLRISSDRDRLKADIAEACEVITELRDQFAFYAEEHRKSGKTEKAETNEHFRDRASQYLERVKQ